MKCKDLSWTVATDCTYADAFGLNGFYVISGESGDWTLRYPFETGMYYDQGYETQSSARAAAQDNFSQRIAANIREDGSDIQKTKIIDTIEILLNEGAFDGDHHKAYAIDQALRRLAGDAYETLIAEYCDGEDGPGTYGWDVGMPS